MKLLDTGYKSIWMAAGLAVAMICLPARADAALVINLNGYTGSIGNGVSCTDNAGCDVNIAPNIINWTPALLGNWTTNIQLGTSNAPGGTFANLHLDSLLQASAGDTLNITVSDFFTSPTGPGQLSYNMGGSTGESVGIVSGHGIKTNAQLGYFFQTPECTDTLTPTPFGCGPVTIDHGALPGGYTMVLYQSITVPGATEVLSLNTNVRNSVPEPATLALFGLGLAGVGTVARRRRQRQQSR